MSNNVSYPAVAQFSRKAVKTFLLEAKRDRDKTCKQLADEITALSRNMVYLEGEIQRRRDFVIRLIESLKSIFNKSYLDFGFKIVAQIGSLIVLLKSLRTGKAIGQAILALISFINGLLDKEFRDLFKLPTAQRRTLKDAERSLKAAVQKAKRFKREIDTLDREITKRKRRIEELQNAQRRIGCRV